MTKLSRILGILTWLCLLPLQAEAATTYTLRSAATGQCMLYGGTGGTGNPRQRIFLGACAGKNARFKLSSLSCTMTSCKGRIQANAGIDSKGRILANAIDKRCLQGRIPGTSSLLVTLEPCNAGSAQNWTIIRQFVLAAGYLYTAATGQGWRATNTPDGRVALANTSLFDPTRKFNMVLDR